MQDIFDAMHVCFNYDCISPPSFFAMQASGISTTTSIVSGAIYYIRNANSGHYLWQENSGILMLFSMRITAGLIRRGR